MRAIEFLSELFQPGKNWKWEFRGSEEAFASFKIGDVEYIWHAHSKPRDPKSWIIEFKTRDEVDQDKSFGLTGSGNAAEVMSTVVDITRAFLEQYKDNVMELAFLAKEESRASLYAKMIKRLLPDWNLYQRNKGGTEFYLTNPKAYDLEEAELDPKGWGETPYGTDIDYFGLRVQMRPSTFLKLALPLGPAETNPEVEKHMRAGGKIAFPMLDIEIPDSWQEGNFKEPAKVVGHEGRNRMTTWIKLHGDDPIQVNIKPRSWYRRSHLTDQHIAAINQGMIGQRGNFVEGPLFNAESVLEASVSGYGGQHKWMGNEPYRHLVEKDIEEDMTRRGFLGGLAGMAAGAAGAKQMPIQPAKKPEVAYNVLSNNPNNEIAMLKAAKKAGIKGPELAQFMAQMKHESWDFERLKEKPQPGVKGYFAKKYDPKFAPKTAKILGNKHIGDGERYHGRGFVQLTGRDNYRMAGQALGIDLLNHPELASKPDIAAQIAVWYWNTRVKPYVNNFADTRAVTQKINPAARGLEDRHENFKDYMRII